MAPLDYSPPANPALVPPPQSVVQSQAKDGRAWHDYTVRPGDSLAKLAARYDTTIAALVAKNSIDDPRLLVTGSTVKVPGKAPKRSHAPATRKADPRRSWAKAKAPTRWTAVHTVRRGDNLSTIASRHGTTWRAVLKANKISDPKLIKDGQKVRIPSKTKSTATKAAKKTTAKKTTPKKAKKAAPKTPKPTKENTFLGRTYSDKVVAQAAKNRHTLQHAAVPSRSQTRALIVRTAQQYGVNPRLALGIAWQESGWNQRAVSVANAVGVMQVMPGTGEWCSRMVGHDLNLLDARDNITAGVVFLRWLTQHADGSDEAIAGYYQGLGSVQQKGMYDDTKDYVASVTSHMKRF